MKKDIKVSTYTSARLVPATHYNQRVGPRLSVARPRNHVEASRMSKHLELKCGGNAWCDTYKSDRTIKTRNHSLFRRYCQQQSAPKQVAFTSFLHKCCSPSLQVPIETKKFKVSSRQVSKRTLHASTLPYLQMTLLLYSFRIVGEKRGLVRQLGKTSAAETHIKRQVERMQASYGGRE